MHQSIETQIRKIELDLSDSLAQLPKPASEYTVKHLIRQRVQQVHKLGAEYACQHFGLKHFTTASDFSEIGRIADDIYRVFAYARNKEAALIALTSITLAHATRSKARQISNAIATNDLDNILEVDANNLAAVMTGLARPTKIGIKQIELRLPSGMAVEPFTPSNVKQIELSLPPNFQAPAFTTMFQQTDLPGSPSDLTDLSNPDIVDTTTTTDTTTTIDLFIWRTEEDNLVCDEWCKPLEDQTWSIDDPTIPTPVLDTHPNCRCRLELTTEDVATGGD